MSRMMDPTFHAAVDRLRVPGMGTEVVARLLANLVALVRPQHVLEVGMGYTTPFLAAALADVHDQVQAEAAALAAKTRRHLEGKRALDDDWLLAEPALLAPESFVDPYRPALVAVDNLSIAESSAALAWEVLREASVSTRGSGWSTPVCASVPPSYRSTSVRSISPGSTPGSACTSSTTSGISSTRTAASW